MAGIARMDYSTFVSYNIAGGVLWTITMVLLGFFLGKALPDAGKYIDYIILAIIVLSIIPIILEYLKTNKGSTIK